MDVTQQITDLLMDAVKLSIAAAGNTAGNHALIVQSSLDLDGSISLSWNRYYNGDDQIAEVRP